MTALTGEELLAWVETTSAGWLQLLQRHPEVMTFPCDVMQVGTVAKLLQHIVAVELRYAQRLADVTASAYEDLPYGSPEEIFAIHTQAMELLRELLARPELDWEEWIVFETRSLGPIKASRRTVLVHLLMHAVRHYAQLATLVRQHGTKPEWPMDYLFMGAQRV